MFSEEESCEQAHANDAARRQQGNGSEKDHGELCVGDRERCERYVLRQLEMEKAFHPFTGLRSIDKSIGSSPSSSAFGERVSASRSYHP
jgi:hypothetical protein